MKNIFLVLGYGIPKDILQDQNYGTYLSTVFNVIYASQKKESTPLVILSGGKADMFRPYKRTEAREMERFMRFLLQRVPAQWRAMEFLRESCSLSSLENLLFTAKLLSQKNIRTGNLTIFCEASRKQRTSVLAKKIFPKNIHRTIHPVDFDTSSNRYRDPIFISSYQRKALAEDLIAMKSAKTLAQHHDLHKEKFAFLHAAGPEKHVLAVAEWEKKMSQHLKKEHSTDTISYVR